MHFNHLLSQTTVLPPSFYQKGNVCTIAKKLLGKVLLTTYHQEITAIVITETEAYNGVQDKACHAYNYRKTKRNEAMYMNGGNAYIYLCYGMHLLFNVVTNQENIPDAILIRSGWPICGQSFMYKRRGKIIEDHSITKGPANLTKSLGIQIASNKHPLQHNPIMILNTQIKIPSTNIITTSRIGINYAGEDAFLPYRFYIKNCSAVTQPI